MKRDEVGFMMINWIQELVMMINRLLRSNDITQRQWNIMILSNWFQRVTETYLSQDCTDCCKMSKFTLFKIVDPGVNHSLSKLNHVFDQGQSIWWSNWWVLLVKAKLSQWHYNEMTFDSKFLKFLTFLTNNRLVVDSWEDERERKDEEERERMREREGQYLIDDDWGQRMNNLQ